MLKIQLISDVHQRWNKVNFDPQAHVITALGDIADGVDGVDWLAAQNKPVIYVPGNHEFYGGDLTTRLEEMRDRAEGTQIIVADKLTVTVGKTRFLCATLWTDHNCMNPDLMAHSLASLNDYRNIKSSAWFSSIDNQDKYLGLLSDFEEKNPQHKGLLPKSPERMNPLVALALHRDALDYLTQELASPWDGDTVVLTHHAPSLNSIMLSGYFTNTEVRKFPTLLKRKNKPHKIGAYASSLDYLFLNYKIEMWLHGHLHEGLRYAINGADVISNPTGYMDSQNERYMPSMILKIQDKTRHSKVLCLMLYESMQAQIEITSLIKKQIMHDEKSPFNGFVSIDDFHCLCSIYNQSISPLLQQSSRDRYRPDFILEPMNMMKITSIYGELPDKLETTHKTRFFHEMLTRTISNENRTRDWLKAVQANEALDRWTVEGDI